MQICRHALASWQVHVLRRVSAGAAAAAERPAVRSSRTRRYRTLRIRVMRPVPLVDLQGDCQPPRRDRRFDLGANDAAYLRHDGNRSGKPAERLLAAACLRLRSRLREPGDRTHWASVGRSGSGGRRRRRHRPQEVHRAVAGACDEDPQGRAFRSSLGGVAADSRSLSLVCCRHRDRLVNGGRCRSRNHLRRASDPDDGRGGALAAGAGTRQACPKQDAIERPTLGQVATAVRDGAHGTYRAGDVIVSGVTGHFASHPRIHVDTATSLVG
jgi:hypothetical protein